MKHIPEKIAAAILSGALLAGGVAVVSTVRAGEQSPAKAKSISLVVDDRPLPADLKLNSSLAPIVKKVAPSVVKASLRQPDSERSVLPPVFRRTSKNVLPA
jgi:S1-C subfamily serine protease